MEQELAPPWLSFNEFGSKLGLLFGLGFNGMQIREVVSVFGLS